MSKNIFNQDIISNQNSIKLKNFSITKKIDNFILFIGSFFDWIWIVLIAVIIGNVVLRYVFKSGMIELEELQWHLYAIGWLVGLSSTYVVDSHVRVDALSDKFSFKKKLWFEFFWYFTFIFTIYYFSFLLCHSFF